MYGEKLKTALQKHLNCMTVRSKLLLIFCVFILLVFVLCLRFLLIMRSIYTEKFNSIAEMNQSQLITNISSEMAKSAHTLDTISSNPILYKFIQNDSVSAYEAYLVFHENISPMLSNTISGSFSNDIRIFSDNQCLGISRITNNALNTLDNYSLHTDIQSQASWKYISVKQAYLQKNYLCSSRSRQIIYSSGESGIITYALLVNPSRLESLICAEIEAGVHIFLADENDTIFLSSDKQYLNSPLSSLPDGIGAYCVTHNAKEQDSIQMQGELYRISLSIFSPDESGIGRWKLVYMVPMSVLYMQIRAIWLETLLLCIACLIAAGCMVLLITRNLTRRIQILLDTMAHVRQGKFIPSVAGKRRDEIGIIECNFNETVKQLDSLVAEASAANNRALKAELDAHVLLIMKRESELLSLQHKINPHYLFNTLESIRMELVRQDKRELAGILRAFAQNVRASLYSDEGTSSLEEELHLVENFICIQEYRYPQRVRFEISVQDGLKKCFVPKLCIQPLLENAVLHGVDKKNTGGLVRLRIRQNDEKLQISVYDNGAGMTPEKLESVRHLIYDDEQTAEKLLNRQYSALRNIHWRIVLMYGAEYGLSISSAKDIYTQTSLVMPKQLEEQ